MIVAARRADRLDKLVTEITAAGGTATAVVCDVTSDESVAALKAAAESAGPITLLVNNAGGAHGLDTVEEGKIDDWQWMFDVNVLGTLRVTQALLRLAGGVRRRHDRDGQLHGRVHRVRGRRRLQRREARDDRADRHAAARAERPPDPGDRDRSRHGPHRRVRRWCASAATRQKAAKVYEGVAEPLTADDVADTIVYCATRPHHVNVDRLVLRPLAQAAQHKVHRVVPDS